MANLWFHFFLASEACDYDLPTLFMSSVTLGFSSMWTETFPMFKLGLGKAEEPEIKLSKSAGSWREQGSSRKTSTSASLTILKLLTVWITTNCGKFLKEMGISDHLICLLRNLYAEATVRSGHGIDWFKTGKGVCQGCTYTVTLVI